MAREITISLPSSLTDSLLKRFEGCEGLVAISIQRGASVSPPGDVMTLSGTEAGLHQVTRIFHEQQLHARDDVSLRTTELMSLVSREAQEALLRGEHHSTWEEIVLTIARESTMTRNAMVIMLAAGVLATIGIAQNAVHVVIGAMAIAPGFLPIVRTIFGLVAGDRSTRHGLIDLAKGYGSLLIGAALAAGILRLLGINPLGDDPTYLGSGTLTSYWTTTSVPAILASSVAAVAGVLLVATGRSVLTAGVMIALALIPTAALVAIGLVEGEVAVAGAALLRWSVDAALVASAAAVIFAWKRKTVYRRGSMIAQDNDLSRA
jgi:hypothetical protein